MMPIVCVASGPSLTLADVEYARGKADVLVINDNFRLAHWANWLYACDGQWWDAYASDVQATFHGERWTRDKGAADKYGLHYIASSGEPGLSRDPALIHEGRNSGYQAINLAYHFGARRIVLLGYDMRGGHWFGEHPAAFKARNDFAQFIPQFDALAVDLKSERVDVVNCSRNTALECFPRSTLKQALQ